MTIQNPPKENHHEELRFTTAICQSELEQTLRIGAQKLLQAALEAEVENYLEAHRAERDTAGRRLGRAQWVCRRAAGSNWARAG